MSNRDSNQSFVAILAFAALCWGVPDARAGNDRLEPAARDFREMCAACHGATAKGDGPAAAALDPRPPDLTEIAKRRHGVFPAPAVARMIDGQDPVVAHGNRDMPIWGDHLSEGAAEHSGLGYTRGRIQLLVEYLQSIQVPAAAEKAD